MVRIACAVNNSLTRFYAGTSLAQDAHTLCAHACICRWFTCWSIHLITCTCCLTNSHGVGGGTCLSVVSCPCCGACLLCIRVRCIHGTVQVSSFYFQPKGEGKAFACS